MIIFGGTKGIGKELADYYSKHQYLVSIVGRHPKKEGMQNKINVIKADVTKEDHVEKTFDLHRKQWGKIPDAVIICAAVQGPIGNSWEISVKSIEKTLKINLLGSFIVSRAAIKRMVKAKEGSIIVFSGGGAAYGRPYFNAYAISKAGVLRMVEGMAEELILEGQQQITINAIAPGAVKTGMTMEIIKAGKNAGKKELEEASKVFKNGGTPAKEIIGLVDFLLDRKKNHGLTGRLIHVRDDYQNLIKKYGKNLPDELGLIRRIPLE